VRAGALTLDRDARVVDLCEGAASLLGVAREEVLGRRLGDVLARVAGSGGAAPGRAASAIDDAAFVVAGSGRRLHLALAPAPDGLRARLTAAPPAAWTAAASEQRYRTLFQSIDDGLCVLHVLFDESQRPVDARFLEVNPSFERQSGVADAVGRTVRELVPEMEPHWFDLGGRVALVGEPTRFVERAAAVGRWFEGYAFRIGRPDDHQVAVLFSDVTTRQQAEEALLASESHLHHRAHHDALTGLPNRLLFEDRLQLAVAAAVRHERVLAVLFLDLDGFKLVNDNLGHAIGDEVLGVVAKRLQGALRAGDTLARLHGDEFAILLPEIAAIHDAARLARTLLAEISRPIVLSHTVVNVSASIGVSFYPRDGGDGQALLRAADLAMYQAKLGGKNDVRLFATAMRAPADERVALAQHLDGALERGEMEMLYQPQWDSRTGSISTFEALLRWTSPVLGAVSPRRFVPVAEQRGIFGPIVSWGLDVCGAAARGLSDELHLPLRVAVTSTPAGLVNSRFLSQVEATIVLHGLEPQQLELELGMGALIEGSTELRGSMEHVKELGVRVMLDHFGADTGMVAALLDLPLDGVKLDPTLVQRADRDARLWRGLSAVVSLVHDLGLEVVAVGVETESQRDQMLELGCERLQGALIGRPMTRSEAGAMLRHQEVTKLF
jgi:diguanylate cyclase (GGDEF)-like protein/PAS domain S-box-containing protein